MKRLFFSFHILKLITLFLIIAPNLGLAQTTNPKAGKGIGDNRTPETIRYEKLRKEYEEVKFKFDRLYNPILYNNPIAIRTASALNGFEETETLEIFKTKTQAKIDEWHKNPEIFELITKLEQLEKKMGVKSSSYKKQYDKLVTYRTMLYTRIRQINQQKKEEKKSDDSHQNQIYELDKELADLEESNNQGVKKNIKTQSLDDFLTENNTKSTQQLDDDFLTDSEEEENQNNDLDFLTSDEEKSQKLKGEIISKNGMQGVVNPNTEEILIPFRKWEIVEYKNGIAKVKKTLSSELVCSCSSADYTGTTFTVGFVDKTGEYLDTPIKQKTYSAYTKSTGLYLANSNDSYETTQRKKALAKKKREIALQKCKLKTTQWLNN